MNRRVRSIMRRPKQRGMPRYYYMIDETISWPEITQYGLKGMRWGVIPVAININRPLLHKGKKA